MPWSVIGGLAFWVLGLGGVLALILLVIVLIGATGASLPGVGLSRVLLNCPHCGAETPACEPECRFCRRSFREESTRYRPVIDAPKLRSSDSDGNERNKPVATPETPRLS